MYRWLFLALLLILGGALAAVLRNNRHLPKAGFALGFLAFFLHMHLYVAPYAWLGWLGPAKGFEISVLDAIAFAMIVSTRPVRTPIPIIIGFAIYLAGMLTATISAMQPIAALFYVWQVLRIGMIFVAVSRATTANGATAVGLVAGTGAAVVVQAISSANQSLHGAVQAAGMMGHQNQLGFVTNLAVMPAFAMLLARRHVAWAAIVVSAGAVVAVTGASRATLALFCGGLLLTTVLSVRHRRTAHKTALVWASTLALAAAVPVMLWAVDRRSEVARTSSNDQRSAMIRAANMMIKDSPFGVGPNHYVIVANARGYSEKSGVVWSYFIRSQPVHNGYLLTLAETGYFGIMGVLILFGSFLIIGFRKLKFQGLRDQSEVFVGLYAATIVAFIHTYFEWISIAYTSESVLAMAMGAVVGTVVVKRSRATRIRTTDSSAISMEHSRAEPVDSWVQNEPAGVQGKQANQTVC